MGRKTFISYKYKDFNCNTLYFRDELIKKLDNFGNIYNGEDGLSDDLTGLKADTIKEKLKDMIHGCTVMIVLISPNMINSKWIPWEISYGLKDVTREELRSRRNGLIGVILPDKTGSITYFRTTNSCNQLIYSDNIAPKIMSTNRYNRKRDEYVTGTACGDSFNKDWSSYISYYSWDEFMDNLDEYIENAYKKSRQFYDNYDVKVLD